MNKKIILGIVMSAIFIALGFAIAVDNSAQSTMLRWGSDEY